MNDFDKEINLKIMQELGLEPNRHRQVIDQDSGMAIVINGMPVMAPGYYGGRNSIEFDPYNNKKMMSQLFGHFLEKYADENGVSVSAFYNIDSKDNSGKVECKFSDNQVVTSRPYCRDTLKYVDIVMQLNGDQERNLEKYDIVEKKPTVKPRKKG